MDAVTRYVGERRKGKPLDLSVKGVYWLARRYARLSGFKDWERVHPHRLQHSGASEFFEIAGENDRALIKTMILLGHKYIKTTKTFPSDRVFDVRMKTIDPGTDPDHVAWVSGKYVDQSNKISLGIHTTSTVELALTYQGATTIWTTTSSLNPLDWHTVSMAFDGNTVYAYVDNVRYFLITDPRIGALGDSRVQLSAAGYSHAHFDDVVVDDYGEGRRALVFTWVDDPAFNNEMYYKVGWGTRIDGTPLSWSAVKWTPGKGVGSYVGIGDFTQGAGIAIADLNNNGYLEVVFAWMDNPSGVTRQSTESNGKEESTPIKAPDTGFANHAVRLLGGNLD